MYFSWELFVCFLIIFYVMKQLLNLRSTFWEIQKQVDAELLKKNMENVKERYELDEKVKQGLVIRTRIEEIKTADGNIIVAYNNDNNFFMAQGSNPRELQDNLSKNFPSSEFHITNKKKEMLAITGMREFLRNG